MLPQSLDFGDRPTNFFAITLTLGNQSGNSLAVSRYRYRRAALDLIEQLCKLRFCDRSLNFLHVFQTGQID